MAFISAINQRRNAIGTGENIETKNPVENKDQK